MTVAGGVDRRARPVLHSRICAAVTAASCLVHVWLVAGNHHGLWLNLVMLAMVAVCLPCTVHIWRHGQVRALRRVTASALAMTGVHALLLLGAGAGAGAAASGHIHHAAAPASASAAPSGAVALLAIIAVEVTTAMLAATLLARLRAPLPRAC
jgi:Kef-type K+ transport system membrane component KefB